MLKSMMTALTMKDGGDAVASSSHRNDDPGTPISTFRKRSGCCSAEDVRVERVRPVAPLFPADSLIDSYTREYEDRRARASVDRRSDDNDAGKGGRRSWEIRIDREIAAARRVAALARASLSSQDASSQQRGHDTRRLQRVRSRDGEGASEVPDPSKGDLPHTDSLDLVNTRSGSSLELDRMVETMSDKELLMQVLDDPVSMLRLDEAISRHRQREEARRRGDVVLENGSEEARDGPVAEHRLTHDELPINLWPSDEIIDAASTLSSGSLELNPNESTDDDSARRFLHSQPEDAVAIRAQRGRTASMESLLSSCSDDDAMPTPAGIEAGMSVELNPIQAISENSEVSRKSSHDDNDESNSTQEVPVETLNESMDSSCSDGLPLEDPDTLSRQHEPLHDAAVGSSAVEELGGSEDRKSSGHKPVNAGSSPAYDRRIIVVDNVETGEGVTVIETAIEERSKSPTISAQDPHRDEKKEEDVSDRDPVRRARFAEQEVDRRDPTYQELKNCLSATESEVGSLDGLPLKLQSRWLQSQSPTRQKMLQSLDGLQSLVPRSAEVKRSSPTDDQETTNDEKMSFCEKFSINYFCGGAGTVLDEGPCAQVNAWKEQGDIPLAILDCTNIIHQEDHVAAPVRTSLVRVASGPQAPSYAETIHNREVDPRMEEWVSRQFKMPNRPPKDGSYHLGKSRTVIVHEIVRGNWTWCTAWSPDGDLLAVATENHHLAVIDTKSSTVWRVRHDRRIKGPMRNNTTHSIRCIAWGANYIAIGGTGNAVSILAPNPPYDVLHRITATGFVGSLDWRGDSNVLAIGSRLDAVLLVEIKETEETPSIHGNMQVDSEILQTLDYKHWVNSVKFSPCGTWLAVGEAGGLVAVYKYHDEPRGSVDSKEVARFVRKDSIQSVEWSPDGKWLYAGGEDRKVAVIDTTYWEIVHRENRDRWVQCISASKGGTHVAVGGVSSEISLLDVNNGWESVMGIELKGLVPLSARWHPKDQYLAVTGQDNSILAVETTNARHVKGHHLHSISPILAIEFSPDGRMAIIGNETGVVTIFSLSGTTFITAYELVITLNDRISIEWSLNGLFVVIGAKDSLIIVGKKKNKRQGKKTPPNGSGFSIKKVIRDFGETNSVSIDPLSRYIAVSGLYTRILSVKADFATIIEWNGPHFANAFSPDGNWLAMLGQEKFLTIYDTSEERVDWWRPIFSLKCDFVGRALAWGPLIVGSLLYLAYGGSSNEIFIMEIRAREGTWETVLRIPRDGPINALDWSTEGLLAAAIGNGTVSIVDLAYLQSGVAVNEMDYNWQRQALTCFTEIRRNRGRNSMKSLRWLPAAPGSDRLLAVGGTDGELEILDLTERQRCRGYASR